MKRTPFIGCYNIANMVTLLALFFALCSFVVLQKGYMDQSMLLFMLAGICDGIDGKIARKLNLDDKNRLFGIQIDSLVDVVAYGAIPVTMAYTMGYKSITDILLLFFYLSCATIRLAYFNCVAQLHTGKGKPSYTGIPSTYSVLTLPIVFAIALYLPHDLGAIVVKLGYFITACLFIANINLLGIPFFKKTALTLFGLVIVFWIFHLVSR